jgi:Flp pilus assembly protein TadB
VAQTKRKRRTKHRGNAAGVVEARGRTGRKPTAAEKKLSAREEAKVRRTDRLDKPPTWSGALNRALIATAVLFVVSVALLGFSIGRAVVLLPVVLAIYVPFGYATDAAVYRARQRKKARQAGGK